MSDPQPIVVKESEVLAGVLEAFAMLGIPADRRNTGGLYNEKGRYVPCGTPGDSDITATIHRGRHTGKRCDVETKRPGERPTAAQYERLHRVIDAGGLAFWVDDARVAFGVLTRILDDPRLIGLGIDDQGNGYLFVDTDESEGTER